ncbi:T9SS type A sorting domain-containing protein [uncultured Polaribacter sp.]|uniref:T9SS type A sorting domain-containing protein n=1 Tax=uncultured Polaribacter sp. TaxID=174711 RepID=UPI00262D83DB|nr:T9SS type A sorting domain-containing protein [uncultured Polaribacter sp.]
MKKITLKRYAFLFFSLTVLQATAQQFLGEGTYRIRNERSGSSLYLSNVVSGNENNDNGKVMRLTPLGATTVPGTTQNVLSQEWRVIRSGDSFEFNGDQYAEYYFQSTVNTTNFIEFSNTTATGGTRARLRGTAAANSDENERGFIIQKKANNTYRLISTALTAAGTVYVGTLITDSGGTNFNQNAGINGDNRGEFFFELQTANPNTNYWLGTGGTNVKRWTDAGNWSKGTVPTVTDNVYIPDDQPNDPELPGTLTGGVANNLVVEPDAVLTISSGSSLIVSGKSFGEVSPRFNINDTNWHLLSSPTEGLEYISASGTDWITTYNIDDAGQVVATNVGIGTYDNTVDADGDWSYLQSTDNTAKTFTTGQGYAVKRKSPTTGQVRFPGTLKTDDFIGTISVGNMGAATENRWNLVGNPYTAYILASDLVSANSANLTMSHQAVYVWNNDKVGGAGYEALSGTDYIHPAQGFFVNAANSTADNFTITKAMLSDRNNVTFFKNPTASIELFVAEGEKIATTAINFLENKTTGLDPSFDVGTFSGVEASSLNIYTQLVSDNKGVSFLRQALPNDGLENMVIPVGVTATTDAEITFTANALNVAAGYKVFLEDRSNNTFNRLDETDSKYTTTVKSQTTDGRFFLHVSNKAVLSLDSELLSSVGIYTSNASTLRIVGLQKGAVSVKLYNVLGKEVMRSNFIGENINEIKLPRLAKGLYVVQLETETGNLNKKIVLE